MSASKSIRFLKNNLLWILFIAFGIYAIMSRQDEFIFASQNEYAFGKYTLWLIFFLFFGYSLYSSTKENFFKTLAMITKKYWGWQIGLDLYIGLLFSLTLIYFQGGVLIFFIWLLPVLIYANLATLLYLALNYDTIVTLFMS